MKKWEIKQQDSSAVKKLAGETGLSEFVAKLLLNRGITDREGAEDFFNGSCISDPMEIADMDKAKRYHPHVIVITSPQMPTGCTIADEEIEKIIKSHPESVIMLDEAYWGYGDDSNRFEREMITKYSNVVITRTFSKFYGLANIRIGYGLCSYPLRRTIGLDLPLFRASGISRKIAIEAVRDTAYYRKMRELTNEIREWFTAELNAIEGVHAFQSASNFVFVRLENTDAEKVKAYMEENNILVRLFTDRDVLHLRITIAPKDIMKRVLFHLKHAIADSRGGKER